MQRRFPPISRLRSAILLLAYSAVLFSVNAWAAGQTGRITHDLTVGAAHDVQLKAGQKVNVLKQSGQTIVIGVQLPDGSMGIFQIDATSVDLTSVDKPPAVPVASTPAVTNPAPVNPIAAPPAPPPSNPPAPPPAAVTPSAPATTADPNLPEDKVTLVHVSLPENTRLPPPYSDFDKAKAGAYSYRLYLPPGYYEHPDFHYPALFKMSPDGNAGIGNFQSHAQEEGWIVVMLMEAKNGSWGPIYGDMLATYADVVAKGLRIQPGLQFATGFSGGGRGSSIFTQICPGFDGELLQGAGFAVDNGKYHLDGIPREHPYAVFMTMGLKDSNRKEIDQLKSQLSGIPFKAATFEGGHMWAPPALVVRGLDWLVEQAFSGDSISDDLRRCGMRQFGFLAKRWNNETDEAQKADEAGGLAALGDKLNFPSNSAEATELQKIKDFHPPTK